MHAGTRIERVGLRRDVRTVLAGAIASVALLSAAWPSDAHGQPTKPLAPTRSAPTAPPAAADGLFDPRPLPEALADATARNRLLIVIANLSREKDKAALALWDNPALREWVKWHAIVVHVTDQATIKTLQGAGLIAGMPDQPLVFRNGKQERLFGSIVKEDGGVGGVRIRQAPKEARVKPEEGRPNTSLRMLMRLDWTLKSFQSRDPQWWAAHEASNPRPPAPPTRTFFDQPIMLPEGPPGGVVVFKDGPSAEFGETSACDPVARYAKVLQSVSGGPKVVVDQQAFYLTSWLWERGAAWSPAFTPTSLGALPRWTHTLARESGATLELIKRMKDARTAALPWMNYEGLFAYLMLARTIDEHLESLDFFDAALDDADGRTMIPMADRAALELMLPRLNWADPWTLPGADGDAEAPLKRIRSALSGKKPAKMEQNDFDRLQRFARWLLAVECSRTYGACLAAGRDEEAARVAALLIDAQGLDDVLAGASAKEWLVTTAACLGQARPEHEAWLGAPTAENGKRLLERVRAFLKSGASAEPDKPGK